MQYGVKLSPYKRIKEEYYKIKKTNVDKNVIAKHLAYFFIACLISRVKIFNALAPFGISFLMVVLVRREEDKKALATLIGTFIGYLTLSREVVFVEQYIVAATLLVILYYLCNFLEKNFKIYMHAVVILSFFIANLFVCGLELYAILAVAVPQIASVIVVYFILDYGTSNFKNINSKHLYSNQELISIGLLIALIIAGTRAVDIPLGPYTVSSMNILALLAIMILAYISEMAVGVTIGVSMGIIVGMSTENMAAYIAVYSIISMAVGMFKDMGKWVTGILFLISYSILKLYLSQQIDLKIFEGIAACSIFYVISSSTYMRLKLNINPKVKKDTITSNYGEKLKGIYTDRLKEFSGLLYNISSILTDLVDNEKLEMKNKSSAIIQSLADRVCSDCDMKEICWKREMHHTYAAFSELIGSYEGDKIKTPYEIERKCLKRTALIKNAEELMNKYIINEMKKTSLSEGRHMLSEQIKSMAGSVEEIVGEFSSDINIDSEMEERIKKALKKNRFTFKDVFCFKDSERRLNIRITLKACGGKHKCLRSILPVINNTTKKNMRIGNEQCAIDTINKCCTVTYEETPKFHVESYSAQKSKDEDGYCGDSQKVFKLKDGSCVAVISDGMGSGPSANRESEATIKLLEKFAKAGFGKLAAINAVNSVINVKYSEEEKYSTVDMASFDLYKGKIDFFKVGAVESVIRRSDGKIEVIKSKTLPIGVLDNVDVDVCEKKVENGDTIIMFSDGVIDYNDERTGNIYWIEEYLKKERSGDPKELAMGLLNEAIKLKDMKVNDDMTVLVSKVYDIFK